MKFDTYSAYDPRATSQTLPAFLTVWPGLARYHDDLVLVGGLVPLCICRHPTGANALPRPATLDVDLGIALGASAGQYGTLSSELSGLGFRATGPNKARYARKCGDFEVYIDFLVEVPEGTHGAAMADDVLANVLPGIDRALQTARTIPLAGTDLFGSEQRTTARVCEAGPYLALKLRAFCWRQQAKDAFDILYTLKHYDGGSDAALEAFAAELDAGNPACPDAVEALRKDFGKENDPGPTRAAHFVYGQPDRSESEDTRLRRTLIQQEAVNFAAALLRTARSRIRSGSCRGLGYGC
jgi:hypothetical protein